MYIYNLKEQFYIKNLFSLDVNKTMAYSMPLNLIKAKPVDWQLHFPTD